MLPLPLRWTIQSVLVPDAAIGTTCFDVPKQGGTYRIAIVSMPAVGATRTWDLEAYLDQGSSPTNLLTPLMVKAIRAPGVFSNLLWPDPTVANNQGGFLEQMLGQMFVDIPPGGCLAFSHTAAAGAETMEARIGYWDLGADDLGPLLGVDPKNVSQGVNGKVTIITPPGSGGGR